MDEIISVVEIVAEDFKQGVSEKTGKHWSLSKYKASNGIEFSCFDKLEIGDVVHLEQNGQYWNGRKPTAADAKHDTIVKALREIYAQNKAILEKLENL